MSDLPTPVTTESTSTPVIQENSSPVTEENSIPATEVPAIPVTEVSAIPVTEVSAIPVTEERAIPASDEIAIPMNDMGNSDPNEPSGDSDPEAERNLNQFVDNIGWGLQAFVILGNVSAGALVFFLQFWALLISSANVDKDPTGIYAGIYLVMLAGLVKFKKLKSTNVARCLALFAAILGATLISLHAWSIHFCRNSYDYCIVFHNNPENMDISAVASCWWFTQRVIIDSLMVGCGVLIVIFNGVFLFFASSYKTTKQ